jgi:RimJ/RimL family protein N-acetyltransferase
MPLLQDPAAHTRLVTRRLILQPLTRRHAGEVHQAIVRSRPALRRWLPFAARQRGEDTLAFIRRTARHPSHRVWGIWERSDAGDADRAHRGPARVGPALYCGTIGLHGVDRDQAIGTLGYWIRTSRAGSGYATEAAAAVLLWAFGPLGLERLSVQAAPENAASLRVIVKLGFAREGVMRQAQKIPGRRARLDWVAFGMTREDWRRARPALARRCGAARPWARPPALGGTVSRAGPWRSVAASSRSPRA